jgi:hypothetical protein
VKFAVISFSVQIEICTYACFISFQGLTWILPECFANSEIALEAGAVPSSNPVSWFDYL